MAPRSTEVRVVISGDASGASRAFRQMSADAQHAGTITVAQAKNIGKALDDLDRKSAGVNRAKIGGSLRSASTSRLDQFGGGGAGGQILSGLGGSEAILAKVGTKAAVATAGVAALGAAAAVAGQKSFAAFESVGTAVGKFQQTLGVSTEEASRFWFTLSAAGVRPEHGLDAINQFSVNLTQNADDLAKFGVEIAKNDQGFADIEGTLFNVIDRYQELRASGEEAAAAQLLSVSVGEEGMRQLQPLLRRTTDELRAMGDSAKNVMSEDDLRRLDAWKAASGQLVASLGLAGAQIGSALAPALTKLVDGLTDAIAVGGKVSGVLVDIAGVTFSPVIVAVRALGEALGAADRAGKGLAGSIGQALGSGTIDEALGGAGQAMAAARAAGSSLTNEFGRLGVAAQQAAAATERVRPAMISAFNGVTAAKAGVADAASSLAAAEQDAARSISDANSSAAASIVSASDQVASARVSWSDAVADVAKAEQQAARSISDAQKGVVEASEDLARAEVDAQRTIADAAEDAARRVVDAEERVIEAKERAARTSRDNGRRVVDAEQAVRDALNDALTNDNPFEAQRAREEAYESLGRVREDVAESELDAARAVQEAEQGLRDATIEAEQQRADAATRAAETITQARERVADAEQRVADAVASASETITAAHARVAEAGNQVAAAEANLANVTWAAEDSRARAHEEAERRITAARKAEADAAVALFNAEIALFNARQSLRTLEQRIYETPAVQSRPATRPWETRARGGPVSAGGTYLVGEDGPELLQMGSQGGNVVPNGGGGGVTVIVQGSVYGDRAQLMQEIAKAVRDGNG